MQPSSLPPAGEVTYVNGRTRLFGIVGHPIEQVRSPEMVTAEFARRGANAIVLPFHVLPEDFDHVVPALMSLANLDGLIFTIPFKAKALALADEVGPQASIVGAVNALARGQGGQWRAEIFDGAGCVEAFRRRGYALEGKRLMLIGAGGAGAAIGVAMAHERPAAMRVFDLDPVRLGELAEKVRRVDGSIAVEIGAPTVAGMDVLLHASPVGMLHDGRLPLDVERLDASLVVFDAVVMPERTPLLRLAEECGCRTVYGREMMQGQIARMADFFRVGAGA